ncbi:MAG: hypothetical protein O7J95_00835, partial [Planctomycetota bacterium]|nr:hypothetical protein [Planctomycetota bacterium]
LAIVCLLFGGFLLAVGPLDYLLLGWLRRRSYTWILFPVLSVGFALLTLHLSSRYLGSSEVRGALVVVDVGRGGEVLRSSRYEALFPRRDERTSVAGEDEVFTLCTARFRDGRALSGRGRRAAPLLYEGRFPEAYRVTRSLRQWSPVLQRRFRLGPDPRIRVPAVDWDALESLDPSESGFEERARDLLRPDLPAGPAVWLRCDESMPYVIQAGSAVLPLRSLWPALRVRGVPARISPSGSGFRDLAVSRGLTTWDVALLVIERSETEIIFYRRLYEAAP